MNAFTTRSLVAAAALLTFACGSAVGAKGKDVGLACKADSDCTSKCTHDADFGGGMCTKVCARDSECPSGALCVNKDGGICAVSCQLDSDCSGFGAAWNCRQEDAPQGGTKKLVCRT